MKLKKILLRLGTENLIKFIDTIVFNVLRLRGSKIINEKNLTEIVLKLNSEKDLLLEKRSRELIIGALKNEEAKLICKLFDIGDKNPWDSINKINFKKKKNLDLLFKLFELDTSNKISIDSSEDKTNPLIISPNYSSFFYQIDVLDKVNKLLNKPIKKALLHMPTGSGKTRTAINLICDYLKSNTESLVVWLAHTEELCQQAHDEFYKGWGIIGNRKIKSYKLFKSHRYDLNDIKNGFVVLSLDYAYSLTKKEQSKFFSFARKCGFVVMDEAHMSVAPTYKLVLEILVNRSTRLLGLTATPGRTATGEEETKKLAIFYNKQKATLKVKGYKTPIHFLQDKGYLAKIKQERLETSISDIKKIFSDAEIKAELKRIKNGRDISKEFVKKLSSDGKRIEMIIDKAISENKNPNNKIIIFAGAIYPAKAIYKILRMENINCCLVTGETNLIERRNNIELFKQEKSNMNIIINYGVLTTGFDAPKANVAIIGRPTQSVTLYSQMVGRVMRGKKAGGKKECKVVTVKDPIYGFRDMSQSFTYWEELWK